MKKIAYIAGITLALVSSLAIARTPKTYIKYVEAHKEYTAKLPLEKGESKISVITDDPDQRITCTFPESASEPIRDTSNCKATINLAAEAIVKLTVSNGSDKYISYKIYVE
jgi:hypothetical protein